MKTAASFPAATRIASATALRPVVFVRDHPQPMLRVEQITWSTPLNEASVEMTVVNRAALDDDDFRGEPAYIAVPRLLRDGQSRWQVLAVGRLERREYSDTAARHKNRLVLLDRWSEALSRSPETFDPVSAYPAQELPVPATLGEALRRLAQHHRVPLCLNGLPTSLREAPRLSPLRTDVPLRSVLVPILEEHQLLVQRDLTLAGGRVTQRLSIRPIEHGRRIQLPFARTDQPVSPIIAIDAQTQSRRARLWIARGGRPRVESTFTLTPGWNPTLENQPDTDYDRRQSSDFSRFGNVYRRWVLNEDAARVQPIFDLGGLFDQPGLSPTPIAFEDCLTQDDAGRPLPPVAEFSTDSGVNWSRLTEPISLMNDRAGLTLDSITLPASLLTAAKNQTLRFRVTASLTSPQPITAQRWQGNPFADVGPERQLDGSDQFFLRRLTPGSLHDAAVKAGQLAADVRDDAAALAAWLLSQIDRETRTGADVTAEARLTLANARPEIRPGDRIDQTLPHARDIDGHPVTLQPRIATVTQVRCDFTEPAQTVLTVLA